MNNQQINNLLAIYHTPPHVRLHSEKVALVAEFLAKKLIKKGEKIDLNLIQSAALLHDLVRVCDMKHFNPKNFQPAPSIEDINKWKEIRKKYKNQHHASAGAEILTELGEPAIANLIFKHKFTRILDPENNPKTWEEKLVYYADKRVAHGQIVSLKERIADGKARNVHAPEDSSISARAEAEVFKLEKEIFDKIKINPEEVNALNAN